MNAAAAVGELSVLHSSVAVTISRQRKHRTRGALPGHVHMHIEPSSPTSRQRMKICRDRVLRKSSIATLLQGVCHELGIVWMCMLGPGVCHSEPHYLTGCACASSPVSPRRVYLLRFVDFVTSGDELCPDEDRDTLLESLLRRLSPRLLLRRAIDAKRKSRAGNYESDITCQTPISLKLLFFL